MKKVFICSPFAGDIEKNIKIAQEICKEVIQRGDSPYAPHVCLTPFLDDNNYKEREMGIKAGIAFLKVCDVILIYGDHNTPGMRAEIRIATENKIKKEYFGYLKDKG